jgi:HSP20 family protein
MNKMTDENTNTAEPTNGKATAAAPKPGVLGDLRDEIDRLWETALANPWRPFRTYSKEPVFPAIDVFEKDGELRVQAELPGIEEKDVHITIEGNVLAITGEKTESTEVDEKDFHRRERSYGRFARRIALPDGAQKDQIAATFKDGVLKVKMPVLKTAARKVEIKAAED